jgi:hypothetical protein
VTDCDDTLAYYDTELYKVVLALQYRYQKSSIKCAFVSEFSFKMLKIVIFVTLTNLKK